MCGPGQGWMWGSGISMPLLALSRCCLKVGPILIALVLLATDCSQTPLFCPTMSRMSGASRQLNTIIACDPRERHDTFSVVSQTGASGVDVAAPGVRSERPDFHRSLSCPTTRWDGKHVHVCSCRHQPNAGLCAGRRSKSRNDQPHGSAPLLFEKKVQCEVGQREVASRKPHAAWVVHRSTSDSECKGNPRGSRACRLERAPLKRSTSIDAWIIQR